MQYFGSLVFLLASLFLSLIVAIDSLFNGTMLFLGSSISLATASAFDFFSPKNHKEGDITSISSNRNKNEI